VPFQGFFLAENCFPQGGAVVTQGDALGWFVVPFQGRNQNA